MSPPTVHGKRCGGRLVPFGPGAPRCLWCESCGAVVDVDAAIATSKPRSKPAAAAYAEGRADERAEIAAWLLSRAATEDAIASLLGDVLGRDAAWSIGCARAYSHAAAAITLGTMGRASDDGILAPGSARTDEESGAEWRRALGVAQGLLNASRQHGDAK